MVEREATNIKRQSSLDIITTGGEVSDKATKRKKKVAAIKKKKIYKRIVDSAFQILTFSSPEK